MNHGREKGKRQKPIKKRREGYTGERKQREKLEAIERSKNKTESTSVKPISIRPIGLQKVKSKEELDAFRKSFMERFRKEILGGNKE